MLCDAICIKFMCSLFLYSSLLVRLGPLVRDKYAREAVEVQVSYQHNPDFWTGLPLLGVEDQHPN